MSQLIFLAPSGGTVTLTNADTASAINVTLPSTNGTLLLADTSNNLTVNDLTVEGIATFEGTGEVYLPKGSTSQRTSSPVTGLIRYNNDGGGFYEGYTASGWVKFTVASQSSYSATYLAIGGGGGGGGAGVSGGGGAGGFSEGSLTFIPSTVYTVTVGAGGGQGSNSNIISSAVTLAESLGGGLGGGNSGGSGGGGNDGQTGGAATQPTSTYGGFGNAGGSYHGGGGGAGVGGTNGTNSPGANAGNGGTGKESSITGTAAYYAGGGGGIGDGSNLGTGGAGGGGDAAYGSGTANTGGGGGAPYGGGGSGVIIISVPTANYSGTTTGSPTVTTNGSFTVMKFTSSGTYTG